MLDLLLLCFWLSIGAGLRFCQLTAKPPWTDEFATLVFSAGNNYDSVLLDRIIDSNSLLQLLKINAEATIQDVISLLITEDTHPPLYFVLSHLWLKLFPTSDGYVSLWGARSLAAIFGILSIPAIYIVGKLAFRSRTAAQLGAALMAVSPYGIFLAQEARHYTFAILFVIASLGYLIVAAKSIWHDRVLSIELILGWIAIDSIGLMVHYFFCLTLIAEAIAILWLLWHKVRIFQLYLSSWLSSDRSSSPPILLEIAPKSMAISISHPRFYGQATPILSNIFWHNLGRLAIVIIAVLAIGLVWIFGVLPKDYGHGTTEWIHYDRSGLLQLVNPICQLLAAWITMLSLLPVEVSFLPVVIISGLIMLFFFIWLIPILKQGLTKQWQKSNNNISIGILFVCLISSILIFFIITYFFGIDITRGARYSFVYFPAIILLVTIALVDNVYSESNRNHLGLTTRINIPMIRLLRLFNNQKSTVIIVILMGILSGLTVNMNWGYQKYYRPDLFASLIDKYSSLPVLIATTHRTLVQTGEVMGIAWELKQHNSHKDVSFLLAHQNSQNSSQATSTLAQAISSKSKPFELWTVNFLAPIELKDCLIDSQALPAIDGYNSSFYRCY